MSTQVNVNLTWLQRRKLGHHPFVGRSVAIRINGDLDAWKWRRNVYLTGPEYDIRIVLLYIGYKEPVYSLLRARNVCAAATTLLLLAGTANAGNYEHDSFSYNRAMSRDTPTGQNSLGPQSWCCGNIPYGVVPDSAPSAFYDAVQIGFGSMYNAIKALNARLNRTSNFDPTYGSTNYSSNLGSMDPNSRGSGVTAW